MTTTVPNLTELFTQLHRAGQNGDYDKGLEIADKILSHDKVNVKAVHCKIVCYLKNGSFDEALELLERADPTLQKELIFERAYCNYRLNNVQEAYDILKAIKDPEFRVKELTAQTLYRLERYQECYSLYVDLIKNSEDEYEDERDTNLAAVVACLSLSSSKPLDNIPDLGEQIYELCYNKACVDVGLQNHAEALKKLSSAEDLCRKTLKEEDATEAEIDNELGIVRAQMGYVYQMMGRDEIALKLYNQVLRNKPNDVALLAVASNNIVTINKDQNVFDSKKRIKAALNENVETKLSSLQKRTIAVNNCLLLMYTNQLVECKTQIHALRAKYPDASAEAVLLEAAVLVREERFNDAVELLKKYKPESDEQGSLHVPLTLVQLLLQQGKVKEAVSNLNNLKPPTSAKLGVVSALVSLNLSLGETDAVVKVLDNAINWHKKNSKQSLSADLLALYRETSRFLVHNKKPKEAIKMLEELRKANPTNPRVIAQLISAYSQFAPEKASEAMKDLPPIENEIVGVDVDGLETSNWSLGVKYVKKSTKVDQSPAFGKDEEKKKSKTRKRKRILPKHYDPNVDPDPERWLPRWQRSTFKKKKDKRGAQSVGKGTQGAVAGDAGEYTTKPSPKPGASGQAKDSPQGPRQQRPGKSAKRKGKK